MSKVSSILNRHMYKDLATKIAESHGLNPLVIRAMCEVESSWNPNARRVEYRFFLKYLAKLGREAMPGYVPPGKLLIKEKLDRSYSYGIMQVMGELAREYGFKGEFSELYDPRTNIDYGCRKLKECLIRRGGDYRKALLCYNGGADKDYPTRVFKVVDRLSLENGEIKT